MKQLFTPILLLWACFASISLQAQATTTDSQKGKLNVTINHSKGEKADTMQAAITVIGMDSTDLDSLEVDTLWADNTKASFSLQVDDKDDEDFPFNTLGESISKGTIIAIISIIAIFGMPVFILFIVFFFRYKNRKARYRLAEQALAAGQPLPEYILHDHQKTTDTTSQGIKNIFTGIGLFFFLWAITDEFSIGAVGILIMCQGIGQWIVGRRKQQTKQQHESAEKPTEEQ